MSHLLVTPPSSDAARSAHYERPRQNSATQGNPNGKATSALTETKGAMQSNADRTSDRSLRREGRRRKGKEQRKRRPTRPGSKSAAPLTWHQGLGDPCRRRNYAPQRQATDQGPVTRQREKGDCGSPWADHCAGIKADTAAVARSSGGLQGHLLSFLLVGT